MGRLIMRLYGPANSCVGIGWPSDSCRRRSSIRVCWSSLRVCCWYPVPLGIAWAAPLNIAPNRLRFIRDAPLVGGVAVVVHSIRFLADRCRGCETMPPPPRSRARPLRVVSSAWDQPVVEASVPPRRMAMPPRWVVPVVAPVVHELPVQDGSAVFPLSEA